MDAFTNLSSKLLVVLIKGVVHLDPDWNAFHLGIPLDVSIDSVLSLLQ